MFSLLDRMIFGRDGLSNAIAQAFVEYEKEMNRGRVVVNHKSHDRKNLVLAKKAEIARQGNLVRD